MNEISPNELTRLFPNASRSTIKRNAIRAEAASRAKLHPAQSSEQAPALGRDDERKAQSASRPLIRITQFRTHLLDIEGKFSSVKNCVDGLRYAGLIYNDREKDIILEVYQEPVKHYHEEQTVIEIEYP